MTKKGLDPGAVVAEIDQQIAEKEQALERLKAERPNSLNWATDREMVYAISELEYLQTEGKVDALLLYSKAIIRELELLVSAEQARSIGRRSGTLGNQRRATRERAEIIQAAIDEMRRFPIRFAGNVNYSDLARLVKKRLKTKSPSIETIRKKLSSSDLIRDTARNLDN